MCNTEESSPTFSSVSSPTTSLPSSPSSTTSSLELSPLKVQSLPVLDPEAKPPSDTQSYTFQATVLVLLSSLLFSLMHATVRYATHELVLPSTLPAISRGVVQFVLTSALIIFLNPSRFLPGLNKVAIRTLVIRGIVGAVSMCLKYYALQRLPVLSAASLFATSPLFASILAYLFLGETLTLTEGCALAIVLLGAILVALREGATNMLGVLSGLGASTMTGCVFVTVRSLGTKVHFLLSVFSLSLGAMIVPPILVYAKDGEEGIKYIFGELVPKLTREELYSLLAVGLCAFSAASCLNRGLQLTKAGRAALLRSIDIPVNFAVGYFVLGELTAKTQVVTGCALITFGTILVAIAKAER